MSVLLLLLIVLFHFSILVFLSYTLALFLNSSERAHYKMKMRLCSMIICKWELEQTRAYQYFTKHNCWHSCCFLQIHKDSSKVLNYLFCVSGGDLRYNVIMICITSDGDTHAFELNQQIVLFLYSRFMVNLCIQWEREAFVPSLPAERSFSWFGSFSVILALPFHWSIR